MVVPNFTNQVSLLIILHSFMESFVLHLKLNCQCGVVLMTSSQIHPHQLGHWLLKIATGPLTYTLKIIIII